MKFILFFLINFIQDPSYIIDQRAADEAERLADEISDCIDRGDCDPSDYPSNSEGLWEIISNPYYIGLLLIVLVLLNLDKFKSKKIKEKEKRYLRYLYLSNQCHSQGTFVQNALTEEELNEYLELNEENVLEEMPKTTEDYRRRQFFWLEELRINEELGPGGYFEFKYLFDEFRKELLYQNSTNPDDYEIKIHEISTADQYINSENLSRKKRYEYFEKQEKLNPHKEILDEWMLDYDENIIEQIKVFKKNLFKYIDLSVPIILEDEKQRLKDFCSSSINLYHKEVEYLKTSGYKISKKNKEEINTLTLEMFKKIKEINTYY